MSGRPWAGFGWNRGFRSGVRAIPLNVTIPDLNFPKTFARAFYLNGRVWVVGGGVKTQSWAPGETVWTNHTDQPAAPVIGMAWNQQGGAYVRGNDLHLFGGNGATLATRENIFSTVTKAWTVGPNYTGGLSMYAQSSTYLPGYDCQIVIAGNNLGNKNTRGFNAAGQISHNFGDIQESQGQPFMGVILAESWEPIIIDSIGRIQKLTGGIWPASAASIPWRPVYSTATEVRPHEYMVCGGNQNGVIAGKKTVMVNSQTAVQTVTADMLYCRIYHSAIKLSTGELLVVGGNDETNTPLATAEIYNPSSNTWTEVDPRPVAAYRAAIVDLNGWPVMIGGESGGPITRVDVFNPSSRRWSNSVYDPNF